MNIQEKRIVGALIPDFHRVWELNYLVDLFFFGITEQSIYMFPLRCWRVAMQKSLSGPRRSWVYGRVYLVKQGHPRKRKWIKD